MKVFFDGYLGCSQFFSTLNSALKGRLVAESLPFTKDEFFKMEVPSKRTHTVLRLVCEMVKAK